MAIATEIHLRDPNLLIPRKTPTGRVILNKYHPLYTNIVWMFIATQPHEIGSGITWQSKTNSSLLTNGGKKLVGTPNGLAIDVGLAGTSFIYYLTNFTKPRKGVTNNMMFCLGYGDTTAHFQAGALASMVDSAENGFSLRAEQTNSTGKVGITVGNSILYHYTSSLSSPTGGEWAIGSILKSSTCQMMVNGIIEAETAFTWSVTSNDLIRLFIGAAASGMNGYIYVPYGTRINMAVMIEGSYSAEWLNILYRDPYQLVMPA